MSTTNTTSTLHCPLSTTIIPLNRTDTDYNLLDQKNTQYEQHNHSAYKGFNPDASGSPSVGGKFTNSQVVGGQNTHTHGGTPSVTYSLETKRSLRDFKEHGLSGGSGSRLRGFASVGVGTIREEPEQTHTMVSLESGMQRSNGGYGPAVEPPDGGQPGMGHTGSPIDASGLHQVEVEAHRFKLETIQQVLKRPIWT